MINFTINPMTTIIIANRTINCHPLKAASKIHATSGIAPNHIITSTIKLSPPAIHNNLPITLNISPIINHILSVGPSTLGVVSDAKSRVLVRTPLMTERRFKIVYFRSQYLSISSTTIYTAMKHITTNMIPIIP